MVLSVRPPKLSSFKEEHVFGCSFFFFFELTHLFWKVMLLYNILVLCFDLCSSQVALLWWWNLPRCVASLATELSSLTEGTVGSDSRLPVTFTSSSRWDWLPKLCDHPYADSLCGRTGRAYVMEGGGCCFWLNVPFFSPCAVSSFQLPRRAHMCLGKEWRFLNRIFFWTTYHIWWGNIKGT